MKLKKLVGLGAAMLLASGVSAWAQTSIRVEVTGRSATDRGG